LLKVPSATEIDLGFRYRFNVRRVPLSLRFQALNVTNERTWQIGPSVMRV
jgi:outer membrane receptor protein involved in Fe transport